MGRLDDRVVLVYGGGRGIGRGCALAIAAEGGSVLVADINADSATAVAAEITARGDRAIGRWCDVADAAAVQAVVDAALAEWGRIDGVVNLAYAGTGRVLFEAVTVEALRREFEVGVVGSFLTMRTALDELKKTKGSVVNFSSGSAIEGTPTLTAYASAKGGIRAMSHVAANELGASGVRVNTVCPLGLSPSVAKYYEANPAEYEASAGRVPLRRYGDPESDIGPAVAFLLSDDARFVTGQTVMLDGGQTHL
jgi:NAD(P)-dependent dehydrogenase (short-subunit alcohol dehydrogenase family)